MTEADLLAAARRLRDRVEASGSLDPDVTFSPGLAAELVRRGVLELDGVGAGILDLDRLAGLVAELERGEGRGDA